VSSDLAITNVDEYRLERPAPPPQPTPPPIQGLQQVKDLRPAEKPFVSL